MARILIIEDDPMNADMLSRRLIKKGHAITVAVDGPEGIARAIDDRPELVLLDISLPKMDGWEVAERLKGDERTRAIPIVALTAYAFRGDRDRAIAAGCDDFDTKPVDLPRLLEKIDAALAKRAG